MKLKKLILPIVAAVLCFVSAATGIGEIAGFSVVILVGYIAKETL
jgi:hypothetical protein